MNRFASLRRRSSSLTTRPIEPRVHLLGLLVSLALSLSLAGPTDASEAERAIQSVDLTPYEGRWNRVEDENVERRRILAIDQALNDSSWLVRKMAGGVLRKTTAPPPEMRFSWDGQRLYQKIDSDDGDVSRPVVLDGKPRLGTDSRGEDFHSNWAWEDGGLQLHWRQEQAHGRNVYRVADDRTLIVEHTINVDAISSIEPIVFESRFDRELLPNVSAGTPGAGQTPSSNAN